MWIYIIRRLLYVIPILFGVLLLTFTIFFTVTSPRSMARQELGEKASSDTIAVWLREEGFAYLNEQGLKKVQRLEQQALEKEKTQAHQTKSDSSLATEPSGKGQGDLGEAASSERLTESDIAMYSWPHLFWNYVRDLVSFQLGKNREKRSVLGVIANGIAPSLALTIPAFVLSEFLGIFFALFAALYRNTRIDRVMVIGSVLLMSVNYVAIILFAQKLLAADWSYFPISGYSPGLAGAAYLILPILIYVVVRLGENVRFNRILMLDEIGQDYVRTAKSKGVSQNTMLFKHVLRNAMIPLITRWVVAIPYLYLGSLLLESFFGIPGLGGITVAAAQNYDMYMIRALVFIGTLLYVFSQLLADVMYAVVDPRIKLG